MMPKGIDDPADAPAVGLAINWPGHLRAYLNRSVKDRVRVFNDHCHAQISINWSICQIFSNNGIIRFDT